MNDALKWIDVFFLVLHTSLVLFNLFGWISTRTRRLHFYTIAATLLSWVGLGAFYGWGYCFLTDWHYDVLRKLGHRNLPDSYLTFLITRITGDSPDASLVETLTVCTFVALVLLAFYLRFRSPSRHQDHR